MTNLTIVNPQDKKPCFVGTGSLSTAVHAIVSQQESCEIITVEELLSKSNQWIDQHSFIMICSDVDFKMRHVGFLQSKNAAFFSVIDQRNNIDPSTQIGVGCCIFASNNMTLGSVSIGNHCVIGLNNVFVYNCVIGDYSSVTHHGFFGQCRLGTGTVVGVRTSVPGSSTSPITTANFCNFMSGSMITKDISQPGTYLGNRRIDHNTSLTKRIL